MTTGVVLVGDDALDPRLEVAARHVDGAGDVPLVPLVLLAHVDPRRAVELAAPRARRPRRSRSLTCLRSSL